MGAIYHCHLVDMEQKRHRVAVAHCEQALAAHRNGHITLFLDVAAGQLISIPVESAQLLLDEARSTHPPDLAG